MSKKNNTEHRAISLQLPTSRRILPVLFFLLINIDHNVKSTYETMTDRTQVCKTTDGWFSAMHPITRSIIQGSGIGPTLWIVMASDLCCIFDMNLLFKHADSTNLLVPENTKSVWILLINFQIYGSGPIVMVWLSTSIKLNK